MALNPWPDTRRLHTVDPTPNHPDPRSAPPSTCDGLEQLINISPISYFNLHTGSARRAAPWDKGEVSTPISLDRIRSLT